MFDVDSGVQAVSLLAPAAITATADGTGIDTKDYIGHAKVVLHSAAAGAGTLPTLDVKIQESDDNSTFTDVSGGAFTQVTTVASLQSINLDMDKVKRYVRVTKTIGGTDTPSFVASALFLGKKQVSA